MSAYADSRKRAQALLALIHTLPQSEWQRRLHQIFMSDDTQGPLVVAWMCQQMMRARPYKHAPFWQSQIDACKHAARCGHRVRQGWEAYGMTPWEVVHHRGFYRKPLLPRYGSEPDLRK